MEDGRSSELMDLFATHPQVADELTFFSQDTHSQLPLEVIEKRAIVLAERMRIVREKGYRTGINHLSTLGHLDENLPSSLSDEYGRIVAIDGTVAQESLCPNGALPKYFSIKSARIIYSCSSGNLEVNGDELNATIGPAEL